MIYKTREDGDRIFLSCDCSWYGEIDDLDVMGATTDNGLCPSCGSEDFEDGIFAEEE